MEEFDGWNYSETVADEAYRRAVDKPIPKFWTKLITLPNGQYEAIATQIDEDMVIKARLMENVIRKPSCKNRTEQEQKERDEENRARAARRARQKVRLLAKSFGADHLLTFSYRKNMQDRETVAAHWREFRRLFLLRYPEWQHLAVLERQERGAYHIHCAVKGRQDIRWLLRCWLKAIGQPLEDVAQWIATGKKLGDKSLGAVNVEPPRKRWGGESGQWKANKLAAYLCKYIGKEFQESEKSAKKYWHSKNIIKPIIEKFWLQANTFAEAVMELYDLLFFRGCNVRVYGLSQLGFLWYEGERPPGVNVVVDSPSVFFDV